MITPDYSINPMSLTGRRILVTGASSGIGRETCILLSKLGAAVILVGRNAERLQQTTEQLHGQYHRTEIFDLADRIEEIPAWMKTISSEIGPLHGLVHCAGAQLTMPMQSLRKQHIDNLMLINLTAAILLAKGFRQPGVVSSSGSIVFIASVRGLVGEAAMATYAASKGALISLVKSIAIEYAYQGIRINCVVPALVQTEMFDQAREILTPEQVAAIVAMHPLGLGTSRDVANAIAFLLADTGRWITGSSLIVDGGYTAH